MALWRWRTLENGMVEVDMGDGWVVPYAGGASPPVHERVRSTQDRVLQWVGLANKYGAKYDVPPSWILAVIYAESGGDPQAENYCCAGLMAIYYSVHGKRREDMLDPEKNVDYGTSLLARSRSSGWDLPAAASMHVAGAKVEAGGRVRPWSGGCRAAREPGHPKFPGGSPWGYCEHMLPITDAGDFATGYIDRVVRANNSFVYWLEHGRFPDQEESRPVPEQPGTPRPSPPTRPPLTARGPAIAAAPFAIGAAAGFALVRWSLPRL